MKGSIFEETEFKKGKKEKRTYDLWKPSPPIPPQRLAGLLKNNPVLRKIDSGERPHKIQRKNWTVLY
jgi:hypothetical protein